MSNVCQELRDRLHAFKAGELSPLWRTRIEQHLTGCRSCSAEWWLVSELENAAKEGPAPLSNTGKQSILRAVHAEVGSAREPTRRWRWPRIVIPALAAGAAAAVLLLVLATDPSPATVAERSGWIARDSGVEAFAPTPARTTFESKRNRPRLRVDRGTVVVQFERQPGSEPLQVATPHATVVVRGTVFSVDASRERTTVCVERGRVEVRTAGGALALLDPGDSIAVTDEGSSRAPCGERETTLMEQTFRARPQPQPEPEVEPDPAPPAIAAAPLSPTVAAAPELPEPRPAAAAVIDAARSHWRSGDALVALADLEALMARADLDATSRTEALYLTATIHRARGQYALAAMLLEKLSGEDVASVARLARFERARILARNLGDRAGAIAQLDVLLADATNDTVADEASFERCALLLEGRELARGRGCLTAHLQRFPHSGRLQEASQLLETLESSRP